MRVINLYAGSITIQEQHSEIGGRLDTQRIEVGVIVCEAHHHRIPIAGGNETIDIRHNLAGSISMTRFNQERAGKFRILHRHGSIGEEEYVIRLVGMHRYDLTLESFDLTKRLTRIPLHHSLRFGDGGMILSCGNIIAEKTRHGDLPFRIFGKGNADCIPQPLGKERTDSQSTFYATVFRISGLCHAKMQGIIHPFGFHSLDEQTHGLGHHHCVGSFD